MRNMLKVFLAALLILWIIDQPESGYAQSDILDAFSSLSGWQTIASDQVIINLQLQNGYSGNGIKFDFDFTTGAGYGGIRKIFPIDLPENYQFSFYLKGEATPNNLEFKLLDASGENVWWFNQRNFQFPTEWKKITVKKRQLSFAWGPAEDHTLRQVNSIEIIIASTTGGKGSVYIDQLSFKPLELPDTAPPLPVCHASSTIDSQHLCKFMFDQDQHTSWRSMPQPEKQNLIIDFLRYREFGGLSIDWDDHDYASEYDILLSDDQETWTLSYRVNSGKSGRSYIYLKDYDTRYLKIQFIRSNRGLGYAIREIAIKNFDFSQSKENFFSAIAAQKPPGRFPRYFYGEQSYWTVVGVNSDRDEALINEEGMIEVNKGCFSIEPFIFNNGKLISWSGVEIKQSLEKDYLPIPKVEWLHPDFRFTIQTFAEGITDRSVLFIRYQFFNRMEHRLSGDLYLAIRPFQVNPPWQFLNNPGGVAPIEHIDYDKDNKRIIVNSQQFIYLLSQPDNFGAIEFDGGDITDYLVNNLLPENQAVTDHFGHASGAIKFGLNVGVSDSQEIFIAVPLHEEYQAFPIFTDNNSISNFYWQKVEKVSRFWEDRVNRVIFRVPSSAQHLINSIRANIAYILINRDGAGIQPGSRSYERSWIRDGSLTSSALLKMGIQDEVKEFIQWYSGYQAADGKVPCVVDRRGADPVPENDSHGQLIFAIMQYFQFTHDTTFLRYYYPTIRKAAEYLQFLMEQRLTDYYRYGNDSLRSLYGLVPESISHEGYSDKPRHSYWDNFFALKGLKDAVTAAAILGEKSDEEKYSRLKELFQRNLYRSIELTIQRTGIDYIPGCAELGDFDATSTTIALTPCNELQNLPQPFALNTFDRYFTHFTNRLDPTFDWRDYTPYEIRLVGSFILLQQPEKAQQLLEFFLRDQRPLSWNQWTEVVRKGYRTAGFIGDLPHTWVGSDFINAARSIFVYEREADQSLIIGEGLPDAWLESPDGIEINSLPTYYGLLNYSFKKQDTLYCFEAWGNITIPPGNFRLRNFWKNMKKLIKVNGNIYQDLPENYIVFSEIPVKIEIQIK